MTLIESLDRKIAARHLLDHPFYQRWSAGELTLDELRDYATQYYHYALAFPRFLSAAHANCDDIATRQAILENLIEEERGPENHPELWLRFCESLGLDRNDVLASTPSAPTRRLIDTLLDASRRSTAEGLAALYAYESQVPKVADTKIDGLAKFYGIRDDRSIRFFTVHREADVDHSETSRAILTDLAADDLSRSRAEASVDATLDALYGFLDGVNAEACAVVN